MARKAGRLQKLLYGLITAAGIIFLVEAGLRIFWGQPGQLEAISRVAQCQIQQSGDRAWMECGHPEDRVELASIKTKPRVVVVGGSSVRDPFKPVPDDNFPEHLGRRMPEVEVVNLGKAGQSMGGVAWVVSQLAALKPDLVVLYEGHNDYAQTVFTGRIAGTRLWMIPVLKILEKSWIYTGLTQQTKGVAAAPKKPGLIPMGGPNPPDICFTIPRSQRRGILAITDDTALEVREEVTARFRSDLKTAIRSSPAPVIVSTLLRNAEYPPAGVLLEESNPCARALNCMQNEQLTDHQPLLSFAQENCPQSSIALWLESRVKAETGDLLGAVEPWKASLDMDPLPLRAPYIADSIVREVTLETGATLLDLEPVVGALPAWRYFTDTLHPSTEGAELIAASLEPLVREKLKSGD
jgi:lysophospholipase L1-like esterase